MSIHTMRFLWWENERAQLQATPVRLFARDLELAKLEAEHHWKSRAYRAADGYEICDEYGLRQHVHYVRERPRTPDAAVESAENERILAELRQIPKPENAANDDEGAFDRHIEIAASRCGVTAERVYDVASREDERDEGVGAARTGQSLMVHAHCGTPSYASNRLRLPN